MDFIQEIIADGGEVYVVGGTNRDKMLNLIHGYNIRSYDFDLLVRGVDMDRLVGILTKYGGVKEVGKSFGIIAFKTNENEYDIALPRREVSTGPGYKDFNIVSDKELAVEIDLERRDATINAVAVRVLSVSDVSNDKIDMDNIIDPFNGVSDIKSKVWRAVGDPFKRFLEDPTRIMRALRQCAQFDLDLDNNTKLAILEHTDLLKIMLGNSSVRLIEELVRLIGSNYPARWINFILNESSIGKLLELRRSDGISEIIELAVRFDLPIEERMFVLLFRCIGTYQQLDSWIKRFQLSAAPHFPSEMIRFILLSKMYYDRLRIIETAIDMRRFIVKMEGVEFSKKLVRLYGVIDKTDTTMLNKLLESNGDTLLSVDEIAINGNELMEMFGIKGKQIGDLKRKIFERIVDGDLVNEKDEIIKYINLTK
jgi:tRNA nucleotidyltransferase (CCA-adding enzyme)